MKALGATFKPGVRHPFALVYQFASARLLTILGRSVSAYFASSSVTIPTVIHFTFSIAFLL